MKALTEESVKSLSMGEKLINFDHGEPIFYSFISFHPDYKNWLILSKNWTYEVKIITIEELVKEDSEWFVEYTFEDLYKHSIEYFAKKLALYQTQYEMSVEKNKDVSND